MVSDTVSAERLSTNRDLRMVAMFVLYLASIDECRSTIRSAYNYPGASKSLDLGVSFLIMRLEGDYLRWMIKENLRAWVHELSNEIGNQPRTKTGVAAALKMARAAMYFNEAWQALNRLPMGSGYEASLKTLASVEAPGPEAAWAWLTEGKPGLAVESRGIDHGDNA